LIKDYNLEVHYHPGKANVVADALSRKAHAEVLASIALVSELQEQIISEQKQDVVEVPHIKKLLEEG
jgi:hypothetical protein